MNPNWLHADDWVKILFSPGLMVPFRSTQNLGNYLVMANIYPLQRTISSCKWKRKWYQVCHYVIETDCCTSASIGEKYEINNQFNCSEKCLIYLLTCQTCTKKYVGQTVDNFRNRWNNYKCNDKKFSKSQLCFQEHIFNHFDRLGHSRLLENVSVTFIQKTFQSLKSEKVIGFTHVLVPWGLNVM